MDARIAPAQPPFPAEIQAWLDRTMPPGKPPPYPRYRPPVWTRC